MKRFTQFFTSFLLALLLAAPALAAEIIFDPEEIRVEVGQTFSIRGQAPAGTAKVELTSLAPPGVSEELGHQEIARRDGRFSWEREASVSGTIVYGFEAFDSGGKPVAAGTFTVHVDKGDPPPTGGLGAEVPAYGRVTRHDPATAIAKLIAGILWAFAPFLAIWFVAAGFPRCLRYPEVTEPLVAGKAMTELRPTWSGWHWLIRGFVLDDPANLPRKVKMRAASGRVGGIPIVFPETTEGVVTATTFQGIPLPWMTARVPLSTRQPRLAFPPEVVLTEDRTEAVIPSSVEPDADRWQWQFLNPGDGRWYPLGAAEAPGLAGMGVAMSVDNGRIDATPNRAAVDLGPTTWRVQAGHYYGVHPLTGAELVIWTDWQQFVLRTKSATPLYTGLAEPYVRRQLGQGVKILVVCSDPSKIRRATCPAPELNGRYGLSFAPFGDGNWYLCGTVASTTEAAKPPEFQIVVEFQNGERDDTRSFKLQADPRPTPSPGPKPKPKTGP